MVREAFKEKRWREEDLRLVARIEQALESFAEQGIPKVTLRQIYYVLVAENRVANVKGAYPKLSDLVSDARLCGLLDWDSFVDKGREAFLPMHFDDLTEFAANFDHWYKLDRWEGQENYVEIWVEKAGMGTFMQPFAHKWHLPFLANRGYGSMTAMYEAAQRYHDAASDGKELHLAYLGDHDPSGLDMDRDIEERMRMFGIDLTVHRIALTTQQVREYRPPNNPANLFDSRAEKYIARFGRNSWEVDALNPTKLRDLTEELLGSLLDLRKKEAVVKRENTHKKKLQLAVKDILASEKKRKGRS